MQPYHKIDERWPIFGCKDYDSYLEKYLVKGQFHEGVPNEIKKSFDIVEHHIAHSWYNYPAYDEALNKVLRTFEMAVKLKCELLSIPVKNNAQKSRKLFDLIKDVSSHEPNKRQSIFLDFLRILRNDSMHENANLFGGSIAYDKILLSVNVINILFASESYMTSLDQLTAQRRKEMESLNGKIFTLESKEKNLLIHTLGLSDTLKLGKDELVLFHVDAVCKLTDDLRNKQFYPRPIPYEILNPVITSKGITGIDFNTKETLKITITDHELNLKAAKNFTKYLYDLKVGEFNINPYLTNMMHDIANGLQKFRYKHYQSLKFNNG
jgi:hypothetical protein